MRRLLLTTLLVAIVAASARAQSADGQARAADVRGTAERRVAASPEQWTRLAIGDVVPVSSAVRTGTDSAVLLSLPDQHVIRIGENATVEIKTIGQDHSFSFALLAGRIWSFVDKAVRPARYEVETGSVILGVSGTLFSVERDAATDELDASVRDGEVRLRRARLQKTLAKGLQIRVAGGRLGPATPRQQTKATLAMWKAVGSSEKWAKPHGELRLNKAIDESARGIRKERQAERTRHGGARRKGTAARRRA